MLTRKNLMKIQPKNKQIKIRRKKRFKLKRLPPIRLLQRKNQVRRKMWPEKQKKK